MRNITLKIFLSVLLATLLTGCGIPAVSALLPAVSDSSILLVTPDPNATATPTPFGPQSTATLGPNERAVSPSPTPTLDADAPWGDFPAPVEPSAIDIRPPATPIQLDEDVVNIILLGSDQRPYTGGYRTDTMMLVSLDPSEGTATLISFPRDLYVYLPGWRVDRINTADIRGGFKMLSDTIAYNFGLEVHHWVRLNFWDFTSAIDSLGGITVRSTGYLNDECGGRYWTYQAGRSYNMDGFEALCYVRMRKTSGDFDRLRRQQEVVQAIFNKVLRLDGLARVPQLYEEFRGLVETDMTLGDVLPLVPLAVKLSSNQDGIRQFSINREMTEFWRVPYSGASVLLPKWDEINVMLEEAFGPSTR